MTGAASPGRSVEDVVRQTAMQQVFECMSVGMAITLEDGVLIEVNPALLTLIGIDRDRALGQTLDALLGGDLSLSHPADLADRRQRTFTRPDGGRVWVQVTASQVTGRDGRLLLKVFAVEDITDCKALEGELRARALLDPVTGLPNRYLLEDRLKHAITARDRGGHELAVLFVDLDGFKAVNDTGGHLVGDLVLREAGGRIASCARAADTVSRWAGDEFVVLCVGAAVPEDVQSIAARITAACAEPFHIDLLDFQLGASVGVAITEPSTHADADRLIDLADQAMYVAKSLSR